MKLIGYILLIIGIVSTIVFGIQVINQSESFNLFGLKIGVSSANWSPLIISVIILIIGMIMVMARRKNYTRI